MSTSNEKNIRSTVALVRSAKEDANQITESEVRDMVREAVALSGGLDFIKDGQVVVIKPNLVTTRNVPGSVKPLMMPFSNPFEKSVQVPELVNGITTDRRITKAMIELVRKVNPTGKVYIMECAGDGKTSENFKLMGYTHENIPGVNAFVSMGEEGNFRSVESDDLVAVKVKNQKYKNLPKFLNNRYYYDKTYYSADVIISLCCLKNHMNAAVTGGIKNVGIGARPANIYSPKGKTISAFVIGHTWEPLNNFIHDYYSARPVNFVLVDGLQGLAYGPAAQGAPSYEEAKMNMRLIIASKDAVACDTVQSCIVGIDPEKVKYLKDLARDGFGTIDTSEITVVGNARVDEVKKRFPLPGGILGRILSSGPKKTVYEDFEAPEILIENIHIEDNQLTAKLNTDSKTKKVEMHIDGKLVKTFTKGFDRLQFPLNGYISEGSHELTFYAYDRFLNCGYKTATINNKTSGLDN
jgi:uncharacterized protein (DUF362 family)